MNYQYLFRLFWGILFFSWISIPLTAQIKTETSWKKIDTISIPIPPPEHPRLYLRESHITELEMRMENPILSDIVDRLRSQAETSLQFKIEWDAIQYLISKDEALGRSIVDSTLALLKRNELPDIGDAARVTGRMMVTGAIVYDWLYELLTSDEKDAFIQEFIRLAKTLECGYPPVRQGSVTGHSSESFIMRDMLSAGIAIYDEFPEMYELAAARFFREHLPARNWLYYGKAYHQGDSYGPYRFSWDTYPLMIFDRLGIDNIYNPKQQYVPYYYIYVTRPDGQRMRSGNTFAHNAPRGRRWSQYIGTLFTASYYNDGILLEQFLKQGGQDGNQNIFQFLWWDVTLQREPIHTLPLSMYFGSPFGWMVARTGWDENSVIAEMKINVYNFNNHQHLDAGSFQIYHKGPLATDSGLYYGTSGFYGSSHNKNYYWRTIAHNSLLIYDPEEQFDPRRDYGNDGGQRLVNHRYEPRTLEVLLDQENGYKTGEVLAHSFGPSKQTPEYTYLKGDITRAYSSKVEEVKRSFVFLNLKNEEIPAALIIYDKVVSTDPDFKKYWLLHSIEEPAINGNETIIKRTQDGENGKLVNTCLIPETSNLQINPVGGPGKEFWVFGVNHENAPRSGRDQSYEHSKWRIEISPEVAEYENYFLNVMQVMESNKQHLNINKIEGDKVIGTSVSDHIVFFSENLNTLDSSISFSIENEKDFKILITDLMPGNWKVLRNNEIVIPLATVEEDDGTLYFKGSNGEYTIIKINL